LVITSNFKAGKLEGERKDFYLIGAAIGKKTWKTPAIAQSPSNQI
jgi:hypothetical protein